MPFRIDALATADLDAWVELRGQLWADHPLEEHRTDACNLLSRGDRAAVFVARADGEIVGFAEATLRVDLVNGCSTSPVTFLEGLYVVPQWRQQGVARALCDGIAEWGAAGGCVEFASDALLDNAQGRNVHLALGFRETERVVYFLKTIGRDAT